MIDKKTGKIESIKVVRIEDGQKKTVYPNSFKQNVIPFSYEQAKLVIQARGDEEAFKKELELFN